MARGQGGASATATKVASRGEAVPEARRSIEALLDTVGLSFLQTHAAKSISGWKLHVYCPDTEAVRIALARLWDDADQFGWGMKVATAHFFARHGNGPQAGKGITIYLPHRNSVDEEVAWIERLLEGYPFAGTIAGDEMLSPSLGRRFDLYADPGRDLEPREHADWYKPSEAYLADAAQKAADRLQADNEALASDAFFGSGDSNTAELLDGTGEVPASGLLNGNSLYASFQELHDPTGASEREGYEQVSLCARYSYAVPDEGALELLHAQGPLVEVGAGTGYWAALLRERGGDILAYEQAPPADHLLTGGPRNIYTDMTQWADLRVGDEQAAAAHPDRALFLCWPPHEDDMAFRALAAYQGEKVCYVGEWKHGACATEDFFASLDRDFDCVEQYAIPCWSGRHDNLTVWQRKPVS